MTLKAYLDHIEAKTGKTPQDFLVLARQKGLLQEGVKTSEIVAWLKKDYGLGQGHAMAIVLTIQNATQPRQSKDEQIAKLFKGEKARWRKPFDDLVAKITRFGPDVSLDPTNTYISLLRKGKKFGIVQVTTDRMDIGIKLKGAKATERFKPAGDWNNMVTHRVQISDEKEIDGEVLGWLKSAFDEAMPVRSRVMAQ